MNLFDKMYRHKHRSRSESIKLPGAKTLERSFSHRSKKYGHQLSEMGPWEACASVHCTGCPYRRDGPDHKCLMSAVPSIVFHNHLLHAIHSFVFWTLLTAFFFKLWPNNSCFYYRSYILFIACNPTFFNYINFQINNLDLCEINY